MARRMSALAGAANVAVKISDLGAYDHNWTIESTRPFIRHTIDAFGTERCMFASDFPVAALHGGADAIYDSFKTIVADLSLDEQRALFHDNAVRFYRLEIEPHFLLRYTTVPNRTQSPHNSSSRIQCGLGNPHLTRPSPPTLSYPSIAGRSLHSLGSEAEKESRRRHLRSPSAFGEGDRGRWEAVGLPRLDMVGSCSSTSSTNASNSAKTCARTSSVSIRGSWREPGMISRRQSGSRAASRAWAVFETTLSASALIISTGVAIRSG